LKDSGLIRAAERLSLACRALSAAADDLAVAQRRDRLPVEHTVRELDQEIERVCELAEELERSAASIDMLAGARR
jgi:hypothetical protein